MKKCYFCQKGEVIKKKVRVDFRWGEELFVFENVPASVCQECGEKYFDAKVSRKMEELAKKKTGAVRNISVPVMDFEKLAA